MKLGQQLLIMSSIMSCPLERQNKGSSLFWVGALWHLLLDFFRMRIAKSPCYCTPLCISALLYCNVGRTNCISSNSAVSSLPFTYVLCIYAEQEAIAIVDMVVANNTIRLREIQAAVIAGQRAFRNINSVSLATIDWVLTRNHDRPKQLYRHPDIVKEARLQYVKARIC